MAKQRQQLYEQLVDEHSDSLFRFSYRVLGDWHEAEDQVVEVFEQAWRNIETLRNEAKAKPWLFAICRNRLRNRIGKKKRQINTNDVLNVDKVPTTQNVAIFENREWIQVALQKIDAKHAEVVLLVEMEEFTVDEVAEMLNRPRGTIITWLDRGKRKLRKIFDQMNRDSGQASTNREQISK